MSRVGAAVVAAVATCVVAAPAAAGQPAGRAAAAQQPAVQAAALSDALEVLREALGVPGMAAALVSDGEVVVAEGFGLADVEERRPALPSTPFGLASVTKPVAATLVMDLVEDGVIDLDAPVSSYGVRIVGDRGITVRHLLTHTSRGVPGTRHEYDGDRYGLLGGVIEGATGRPFADLLSERILVPVGMTDTALNPVDNWGGLSASGLGDFARSLGIGAAYAHYPDVYRRLATPYQFGEHHEIVPGKYHLFHNPAAGLNSSVEDLAAFDIALDRGEIVSLATLAEMTAPAVPTQPGRSDLHYGLGWYVQDFSGVRMVWHTGRWAPSTSALYVRVPEERLTFVVLANTDNLTVPFPGIGGGDLSRSAPMLTFFHHAVFPRLHDAALAPIDWTADPGEILTALADVEDRAARTMLERELWAYRQAFASSGQADRAEALRRVASEAFPGSVMSRDESFTATVARAGIVPGLPSARSFARIAVGVAVWLGVVVVALAWMVVRLVRTPGQQPWDWAVWLTATLLLGPVGPIVHRWGGATTRGATMCVVGYSIAWVAAVWMLITLAEPNPLAVLGGTIVLPIVTALLGIRVHVLRRAAGDGYVAAVRRGALSEVMTWSVGVAAFLPLTFAADTYVLSTIPAPSSPFFGAMLSVIALVAMGLIAGVHRVLERRGYRLWPRPSAPGEALRLPTLHDARGLAAASIALFAGVLAVSVGLSS